VLARLRQLLLHELRTETAHSEQRRTLAEVTATSGAAVSHFEVAWEIAENGVASSQETVQDVEVALARMDEGTYGFCEQCSASIPLERLVADPRARFCASCQGRRDAMR
jgi:RNA polymerase-binding transcription factor DksA